MRHTCQNEAETWLGEKLWLWKLTFPCCICTSTREKQLMNNDPVPTIQGWCVPRSFFSKWSKQSRIHCGCTKVPFLQRQYYHSVRMPKFQLNANSIVIKSLTNIPISVMRECFCQRSIQSRTVWFSPLLCEKLLFICHSLLGLCLCQI